LHVTFLYIGCVFCLGEKEPNYTRKHEDIRLSLSFVFCKSQKEQIMASKKIVASDLFVKSAHFFGGL
jgi:hypothetical protein